MKTKKGMENNGLKYACGLFIIIGLGLLFFGFKMTYEKKHVTKDYASTEGKFIGTSLYSDGSQSNDTTYALTYSYVVNGVEYIISTDYGTSIVPKLGTGRTVKYNPENPQEAILTGMGGNALLLFLGFMFTVIPSIIIYSEYFGANENSFNKNFPAVIFGLVFTMIGGAVYWFFCYGGSLSIRNAFDNAGLLIIFPIVFVTVGVYMLLRCFIGSKDDVKLTKEGYCIPDMSRSQLPPADSEEYKEYEHDDNVEKVSDAVKKISPYADVIGSVYRLIGSVVVAVFIITFFQKVSENASRIALIIFLLFDLLFLIASLISCIKFAVWLKRKRMGFDPNENKKDINESLDKAGSISGKIYIVLFLLLWFGFLIVFDYFVIKENSMSLFLFSLIFWAAGIYIAKDKLKKK